MFGQVTVGAFKGATQVVVSEELARDAGADFEQYLADKLGLRIATAGVKALGPEALARAVRHRRWRAVHARRSRPDVSDPREPGSAEKEREPERVHRLIVPATRRATSVRRPVFQIPYLCTHLVFAFEECE